MFSDLMSPCATLRARASRRAVSSWKAIHFFSIGLRKGRVLRTGVGAGQSRRTGWVGAHTRREITHLMRS